MERLAWGLVTLVVVGVVVGGLEWAERADRRREARKADRTRFPWEDWAE